MHDSKSPLPSPPQGVIKPIITPANARVRGPQQPGCNVARPVNRPQSRLVQMKSGCGPANSVLPAAPPVYQPSRTPVAAPAVYRPNVAALLQRKPEIAAPAVYRPQPAVLRQRPLSAPLNAQHVAHPQRMAQPNAEHPKSARYPFRQPQPIQPKAE